MTGLASPLFMLYWLEIVLTWNGLLFFANQESCDLKWVNLHLSWACLGGVFRESKKTSKSTCQLRFTRTLFPAPNANKAIQGDKKQLHVTTITKFFCVHYLAGFDRLRSASIIPAKALNNGKRSTQSNPEIWRIRSYKNSRNGWEMEKNVLVTHGLLHGQKL